MSLTRGRDYGYDNTAYLRRRNTLGLKQIVVPASEPLAIEDVKSYLKVDFASQDNIIQGLITRARQEVEQYTRRALLTQQWQQQWDFAPFSTELANPPLQSVQSIVVVGFDGTPTTVDPSIYIVDTAAQPGRVSLQPGSIWPLWPVMRGWASFQVNYTCGYTAPNQIPGDIMQAMYQLIAFWYLNREGQAPPDGIYKSLDNYRIFGPLQASYRANPATYQAWF